MKQSVTALVVGLLALAVVGGFGAPAFPRGGAPADGCPTSMWMTGRPRRSRSFARRLISTA